MERIMRTKAQIILEFYAEIVAVQSQIAKAQLGSDNFRKQLATHVNTTLTTIFPSGSPDVTTATSVFISRFNRAMSKKTNIGSSSIQRHQHTAITAIKNKIKQALENAQKKLTQLSKEESKDKGEEDQEKDELRGVILRLQEKLKLAEARGERFEQSVREIQLQKGELERELERFQENQKNEGELQEKVVVLNEALNKAGRRSDAKRVESVEGELDNKELHGLNDDLTAELETANKTILSLETQLQNLEQQMGQVQRTEELNKERLNFYEKMVNDYTNEQEEHEKTKQKFAKLKGRHEAQSQTIQDFTGQMKSFSTEVEALQQRLETNEEAKTKLSTELSQLQQEKSDLQ